MPVTPLASPGSPKNRASISPSFMPTPGSTEDHPPKPTCSATSKSRRHQSIRWSSPSNDKASSDDSRDSQEPSRSSLLPKTCPSYDDANSNRQNLCVTPLAHHAQRLHCDIIQIGLGSYRLDPGNRSGHGEVLHQDLQLRLVTFRRRVNAELIVTPPSACRPIGPADPNV